VLARAIDAAVARDGGDVAVRGAGAGGRATDLDDGPHRRVLHHHLVAQRDMMCAAVDPIDDQCHLVAQLVGQPLADHPADDGLIHRLSGEDILAMG